MLQRLTARLALCRFLFGLYDLRRFSCATNCVAQAFTGLERGDFARGDDEFGTGLRVASFTLLACTNDKASEGNELYFFAFAERTGDLFEQQFDDIADLPFRKFCLLG